MMPVPKLTCGFNAIPVKIPASYFWREWQAHLKLIQSFKGPGIAQIVFSKNKVKGHILSDFQDFLGKEINITGETTEIGRM